MRLSKNKLIALVVLPVAYLTIGYILIYNEKLNGLWYWSYFSVPIILGLLPDQLRAFIFENKIVKSISNFFRSIKIKNLLKFLYFWPVPYIAAAIFMDIKDVESWLIRVYCLVGFCLIVLQLFISIIRQGRSNER